MEPRSRSTGLIRLERWAAPLAAIAFLVAFDLTAPRAIEGGAAVTDAAAFAIVRKHCTMCHAKAPVHASVSQAPKNVTLESIAEMQRFAQSILDQAVRSKAMPLGNQTAMTDEERDTLGRWVTGLK